MDNKVCEDLLEMMGSMEQMDLLDLLEVLFKLCIRGSHILTIL